MEALRLTIRGTVQGIGFRPFIYRIASECNLAGYVLNTSGSVVIHIEGTLSDLEKFKTLFEEDLPSGAMISEIDVENVKPTGSTEFRIEESQERGVSLFSIPPDLSTCEECSRELFDRGDRRHDYPFINCTACGPRFTIVNRLPYDRANTSMEIFSLCEQCMEEYENPRDRRYHAEPNACRDCGPTLTLLDEEGEIVESADPVQDAASAILEGKIVAIKGLGGFHLAADAADERAVARLRERKHRDEKPFAVMVPGVAEAARVACLTDEERVVLQSKETPILIAKENEGAPLSKNVAPGLNKVGIFLPYTPLHKMILHRAKRPLIMTSGNLSDEPIVSVNDESTQKLKGIADLYLTHDRDIVQRADDSVVAVLSGDSYPIRRARGYVPSPVVLKDTFPTVAGLGGDLKNTFCIIKENFAFLSQHLGDMVHGSSRELYRSTFQFFTEFLKAELDAVCKDLHPAYFTTGLADEFEGSKIVSLQHHRAHIYSLIAETGFSGKGIGVAFDGTGYGEDGAIWGAEFFLIDDLELERRASFCYFPLQGGDSAIHAPWKTALSLLHHSYGYEESLQIAGNLIRGVEKEAIEIVLEAIDKGVNTVPASSCGRLFDGASALSGVCLKASYEGQAAMLLEGIISDSGRNKPYSWDTREDEGLIRIDQREIVRGIVTDVVGNNGAGMISKRFHATMSDIIFSVCRNLSLEAGGRNVLLSGGVFQNMYLMDQLMREFRKQGFHVFIHRKVPANDGGISLGQAFYAAINMGGK